MTLQTIPGYGLRFPAKSPALQVSFTSSVIDATGEKYAWVGRVWNKDHASKNIRRVGFLFGTVTKAGGSALTVSLQDVSLTAGGPPQPDGTQDQTVAIANADAGFDSNLWYRTGTFSADRTVAFGALLAVVLEYDGSGRLGSDAVNVRNLGAPGWGGGAGAQPAGVLYAASWALTTNLPNIILEFSDGTFGTLAGGFPASAVSVLSFKQDTAGSDEYALEFQVPFPCKVDGAWWFGGVAATTADHSVILYSGTTALETVAIDANHSATPGEDRMNEIAFSQPITLSANTLYRLAIQPTQTASNVRLAYFDVSDANHLQAHDGGPLLCLGSRLNAGAWAAATTTRRPLMGLVLSALDDGAGGGGGIWMPRARQIGV